MIHLVTDSTADLLPEIESKYDVNMISLNVCVGDQTYKESEITQEWFYKLLASVETTPTTSQPSAGEFLALYEKLVQGDDQVISIHISEGLSGTVPNARIAAQEMATDRITVVDSRTASIGLLPIVVAAGEAIAAGQSRAQVVSMLERMVRRCEAVFLVEDLAYLHKGGRINTASRLLGSLLSIKPILYMLDGKIDTLDKARTTKRAKRRVLTEIEQRVGHGPVRAAVGHIQAAEAAHEMAEVVRTRLDCVSLHVTEIGPVIGSHLGPGFLGVGACPVGEDGS